MEQRIPLGATTDALELLATRAIDDLGGGVLLRFKFASYDGGEPYAKEAAKKFQSAFNTFRYRARQRYWRLRKGAATGMDYATFLGPFDDVSCSTTKTPDAWEARLFKKEGAFPLQQVEISHFNGAPVKGFSPELEPDAEEYRSDAASRLREKKK